MGVNLAGYGKITRPYKYQSKSYALGYHSGVDIVLSNPAIKSFTRGTVVKRAYHAAWGNYCIIQSNDGFYCLYAHMKSPCNLAVGQQVIPGQTVIGTMGSTGNSSGTHLHFEVRTNRDNQRSNVDPVAYLRNYGGTMSNNNTVEGRVYNFLTGTLGLNTAGACGVLANIEKECSFNYNLVEKGSGRGFGLCQWTGGRRTNLVNWCKTHGKSHTSLDGQLAFLEYELNNSYSATLMKLRGVDNTAAGAYNAGYYFCYNFERPANYVRRSKERGELAKQYFDKYMNGGGGLIDSVGGDDMGSGGFFDKLGEGIDYLKVNWKSVLVRVILMLLAIFLIFAAIKKGFLD